MESLLLGIGFILNILDKGLIICQWIIYHLLVCLKNFRRLFSLLLSGTKTWVLMLGRLLAFTASLGPGWYNLLKYFFLCPLILRNVEYGRGARNRNLMDLYLPCSLSSSVQRKHDLRVYPDGAPVVIFVSGGAWMIGYKLWSALVGRGLAALGLLVVVPDYRNFPQGDIEDMVADIRLAVQWTHNNAHRFGGNPSKIVLSGQSAGAHICLCLLVEEYERERERERLRDREGGTERQKDVDVSASHTDGETVTSSDLHTHGQRLFSPSLERPSTPVRVSVTPSSRERDRDRERDRARRALLSEGERDSESESDGERERDFSRISFDDLRHVVYSTEEDRERERERDREREERERDCDERSDSEGEEGVLVVEDSTQTEGEREYEEGPRESETHSDTERESESVDNSGVWREVEVEGERVTARERDSVVVVPVRTEIPNRATLSPSDTTSTTTSLPTTSTSEVRRPPIPAAISLPLSQSLPATSGTPVQRTKVRTPTSARHRSPSTSAGHPNAHPHIHHSHHHGHHHAHPHVLSIVRLFIGVSGPYNLQSLVSHLHRRGLDASILSWIARGDLRRFSPSLRLREIVRARLRELAGETDCGRERDTVTRSSVDTATTSATTSTTTVERTTTTSFTTVESTTSSGQGSGGSGVWGLVKTAMSALFTESGSTSVPDQSLPHSLSPHIDEDAFSLLSPHTASSLLFKENGVLRDFPPTAIFHGSEDKSIPIGISDELVRVLDSQGADVQYFVYDGWSHTDAILEAPLGGNGRLFKDMLRMVYRYTEKDEDAEGVKAFAEAGRVRETVESDEDVKLTIETPMVHEALVRIARVLNPF